MFANRTVASLAGGALLLRVTRLSGGTCGEGFDPILLGGIFLGVPVVLYFFGGVFL